MLYRFLISSRIILKAPTILEDENITFVELRCQEKFRIFFFRSINFSFLQQGKVIGDRLSVPVSHPHRRLLEAGNYQPYTTGSTSLPKCELNLVSRGEEGWRVCCKSFPSYATTLRKVPITQKETNTGCFQLVA